MSKDSAKADVVRVVVGPQDLVTPSREESAT